jgi:NitT/TauT family transport system substrate-binding protein
MIAHTVREFSGDGGETMLSPQAHLGVTRRQALLTAALVAGGSPALAQPSLTPLRIASTANDDVTSALYALQQGMFGKAGLDVALSPMTSGSAISAAVAGKAVDIGRSSMLPLITARAKGIGFLLVAPSGLYQATAPTSALVVPVKSPLRSAKELEGKIVSCPALGDLDNVALRNWIDASGGNSKLVQYVEMPGSAVPAELDSGRVAAGTLQNPFLAQAIKRGTVRVFGNHLTSIGPVLLQSAWFTTSAYLEKNAATARAFAQVIGAASAYCNGHQSQTVALLAAFTKMDPATIAGMSRTVFATSLDPVLIQPLIDTAAKYKVIDQPFDARDFFAHLS